jgi:hypothetical protein
MVMVKVKWIIKTLDEIMNDIERGRVKAHYGGPLLGTFMAIIIYTSPQMRFI